MPLYNDASTTYNSLISYNGNDVPGVTPMWMHWRPINGFISGVGGMMIRCIPLFIISLFTGGPPPSSGGGTWRPK